MATVTSAIRRGLRRLVLVGLLLWGLAVLALLVSILAFGSADQADTADVIIVLGAGLRSDNRPGPALIRRAAQGAELWQRGLAPQIICAGGLGLRRTRSEAEACAELLREAGVPDSAIIREDRSRSTEENALYTAEIMQANGWQRALVVSDGYHLLRAHWLFNQVGVTNITSPAQSPPLGNLTTSILREIAAFHWHTFKSLLNLPVTYVPLA
jgi:uncharacterized SAM-binding protein YcdF (DUF218 family)